MSTNTLQETDQAVRSDLRAFLSAYATASPVRDIAVVGNAPMEPEAERARRIDAADLVFRINSFAVDHPGEAPSHGSKVDVIVFNRRAHPTSHFFDHYRTRAFLMTDVAHVWRTTPRAPAEFYPDDLGFWYLPNRAVIQELRSLIWADPGEERVDPTTGTVAAWLGYSLFPEATLVLTGFSFLDQQEQTSWTHHVNGRVVPVPKEHRVGREGELLLSWIESGRATQLP